MLSSKEKCWLVVEGEKRPIQLEARDCFLLSRKRAFSLGSDLALTAVKSEMIYCQAINSITRCGSGRKQHTELASGSVRSTRRVCYSSHPCRSCPTLDCR